MRTPSWLAHLSIRRKIILIVMAVATSVIFLAGAAFLTFEAVGVWRQVVSGLTSQADMLAENLTSSLAFNDPQDTQQVLESLRPIESILSAEVLDSEGQVHARYSRRSVPQGDAQQPAGEPVSLDRDAGTLVVQRNVFLNGQAIGSVSIASDLSRLINLLWTSLAMLVLTLSCCGGLAYLLSQRLQGVISRPISTLARAALEVSENQDFSVRVEKEGEDELGRLTDAFNLMLTQIQFRDDELAGYRSGLERLVKDRTLELEQAQDELVRKDRLATLGRLIATVGHEIRNPLGTVKNCVFSIADALPTGDLDRAERAIDLADRSIRRCDLIIDELLTFSRRRLLELRETEIGGWLNDLLDEQEWPDEVVCIRRFDSHAIVHIDEDQFRRAIVNLLTNAVQAAQAQAQCSESEKKVVPTVTLSIHLREERVEIHCCDNGPGIPRELLSRVFEPLFSTKSFGIGLGLSIVKDLMEAHHGGVELHPRDTGGTRAILWLPLYPIETQRELHSAAVSASPAEEGTS